MSNFDLDDVFETPPSSAPAPPMPVVPVAANPAPEQAEVIYTRPPRKSSGGWLIGLLSFTTFLFAFLWVMAILPDGIIPSPGPEPGPDKGSYVAMFYDDQEMGDYDDEQVTALNSAAIADFLSESADDWKKIDIDQLDELKNLAPAYAEMADQHRTGLPWIVVRVDGRNKGSEQIESPEQIIELVKRSVK